ncbi:hypothetical protein, partial [Magnetospirillum sulfuroxidans]
IKARAASRPKLHRQRNALHSFRASPVTDMVFLNAVMTELKTKNIYIAEAGINNVPGIIADVRGYAWANAYPCYLSRLKTRGISAYTSDPSTCPSATP